MEEGAAEGVVRNRRLRERQTQKRGGGGGGAANINELKVREPVGPPPEGQNALGGTTHTQYNLFQGEAMFHQDLGSIYS